MWLVGRRCILHGFNCLGCTSEQSHGAQRCLNCYVRNGPSTEEGFIAASFATMVVIHDCYVSCFIATDTLYMLKVKQFNRITFDAYLIACSVYDCYNSLITMCLSVAILALCQTSFRPLITLCLANISDSLCEVLSRFHVPAWLGVRAWLLVVTLFNVTRQFHVLSHYMTFDVPYNKPMSRLLYSLFCITYWVWCHRALRDIAWTPISTVRHNASNSQHSRI